jgi:hypothetical protein
MSCVISGFAACAMRAVTPTVTAVVTALRTSTTSFHHRRHFRHRHFSNVKRHAEDVGSWGYSGFAARFRLPAVYPFRFLSAFRKAAYQFRRSAISAKAGLVRQEQVGEAPSMTAQPTTALWVAGSWVAGSGPPAAAGTEAWLTSSV